MIGAWGFKFFESDHDYDIVLHLSADMGLSEYSTSEWSAPLLSLVLVQLFGISACTLLVAPDWICSSTQDLLANV